MRSLDIFKTSEKCKGTVKININNKTILSIHFFVNWMLK